MRAAPAIRFAVAALSLPTVAPAAEPPSPERARALYQEALAAREAKDLGRYHARLEDAAKALPDPASLWFRLAGARVLAGDRTGAFEALEAMLLAGIRRDDFETDADLLPLHDHLRWPPLVAAHAKLATPLVSSQVAFALPAGDRLVEGIAYDAATRAFFLSSVSERAILRRAADGTVARFASVAGSAPGSPLGLAVDAGRHLLWGVTAGLPQGAGLAEVEKNRSSLAAWDLATGLLARRVDVPEGGMLNDLVLAPDGTVYASDPGRGTIVRLRPEATALEDLVPAGTTVSPGGLALAAGGRRLFVADWGYGLGVVELAGARFRWLAPPPYGTMLGIDGLVRDGNDLIGLQNGVTPARLTRFVLSPDGLGIARAELLERAVPGWDEPTLGVVENATLYYVATSHWPAFPDAGRAADAPPLAPVEVRALPLAAAPR